MKTFGDPWSVQIELTLGCTRLCSFCGLRSIRTKPNEDIRFMNIELAEDIAKQLGNWFDHKRIEFALRGEPTLNPNLIEILSLFRRYFPKAQFMLTTNGDILKNNLMIINNLFSVGLNILLIDVYDKNYEWWNKNLVDMGCPIFDFYRDKSLVYGYKGFKHHEITLMDSVARRSGETPIKKLNNQAGNVYSPKYGLFPSKYPILQRCSNPFRELVIFHDGKVPICCMDYREEFVMGKTPEESLKDIWRSNKFNAARVLLYYKQRIFEPCSRCNYKGYRLGLVNCPDNLSLEEAKDILRNKITKKEHFQGKLK